MAKQAIKLTIFAFLNLKCLLIDHSLYKLSKNEFSFVLLNESRKNHKRDF